VLRPAEAFRTHCKHEHLATKTGQPFCLFDFSSEGKGGRYEGHQFGSRRESCHPRGRMHHFKQAETHLREALRKNNNFRAARSYLVAVLSELGRQDEAVAEMNISLEKGEPWVKLLKSGNQQLADEQIRVLTPFENLEIRSRLADALAEGGALKRRPHIVEKATPAELIRGLRVAWELK
jgi:hypothetical protein